MLRSLVQPFTARGASQGKPRVSVIPGGRRPFSAPRGGHRPFSAPRGGLQQRTCPSSTPASHAALSGHHVPSGPHVPRPLQPGQRAWAGGPDTRPCPPDSHPCPSLCCPTAPRPASQHRRGAPPSQTALPFRHPRLGGGLPFPPRTRSVEVTVLT